MNTSRRINLTEYISNFARESLAHFKWQTPIIHNHCISTTMTSVRENDLVNEDYVSGLKAAFTFFSSFFSVIGVKVMRASYEEQSIDFILSHPIPIENVRLGELFEISYEDMLEKLKKRLSDSHCIALDSMVKTYYEAILVYCYNMIFICNSKGIVKEMISELDLFHEIEIFRNRKDDLNGKDSNTGNRR